MQKLRIFVIAVAVCTLAHVGIAASVRVDAPPSAHADMEASATALLPVPPPTARTLSVMLRLDAALTNQAEFALGFDPCQGPDGTALVAGWDKGGWFVRYGRLRQRFAAAAANPSAAGPRALEVRVRLARDGTPVGVAFEADGVPAVFGGLDAGSLLSWLAPGGWDTLRVTARGGAGDVSAEASFIADGTFLIIR